MNSPSKFPGRRRLRPAGPDRLESRLALSASAIATTIRANPAADAIIDGMVTAKTMTLSGRTMPRAEVTLSIGSRTLRTHSDSRGDYSFRMAMAPGTYEADVQAVNRRGQVSDASMSVTEGDAVLAWVDTMVQAAKIDQSNVGLVSRTLAMASGAVYDAVNDIEHFGSVYKFDVAAPKSANPSAAASMAAYTVLSALDPSAKSLLDVTMAQSLAAVGRGRAVNEGLSVGLQVADAMLAWRADDGSSVSVPYVPGTQPGQWRPTPPGYQVAWGPNWGNVTPFAIANPRAYLPPPPPALDSPEYAAELNQVESLGALDSTTRTPDETQIGVFWSYDDPSTGTPPVHYDQIAVEIALQMHNSMAQNARLLGLLNVSMADAGISAWEAKYTYDVWRPITAIQLANTDGNPLTTADPTWQPLGAIGHDGRPNFTPAFPAYVSGHSTFGQALATILTDFYGTDDVHFTISSDELPGVTRSYDSFSDMSMENALSRIYLGLHFWSDEYQGLILGNEVAGAVYSSVMTPNPPRR